MRGRSADRRACLFIVRLRSVALRQGREVFPARDLFDGTAFQQPRKDGGYLVPLAPLVSDGQIDATDLVNRCGRIVGWQDARDRPGVGKAQAAFSDCLTAS